MIIRVSGDAQDTDNYRDRNQYDKGELLDSCITNTIRAQPELYRLIHLWKPQCLARPRPWQTGNRQVTRLTYHIQTRVQRIGIDHEINALRRTCRANKQRRG